MSLKARYCVIAAHKQIPDFSPKYVKRGNVKQCQDPPLHFSEFQGGYLSHPLFTFCLTT